MVKPFLSLMIVLFVLAGTALSIIFTRWNNERHIRMWENMRLRGYEYLHRSRNDYALEFFGKARDLAAVLGKTNYRYANSLVDLAGALSAQGNFNQAKILLRQAASIFEKNSIDDQALRNELLNEEIRSYCQIANIEIQVSAPLDKAIKVCNKIFVLEKSHPKMLLEALTRRQCVYTLIAIGDAARLKNESDVAKDMYAKGHEMSANIAAFKDLDKLTARLLTRQETGKDLETAADLLAKVHSYVKHGEIDSAKATLAKASSIGADDAAVKMKIQYRKAGVEWGQGNFEAAESGYLDLWKNPQFKDRTGRDDVLTKLLWLYRTAGYLSDAERVLRKQIALRTDEFGPDSSKVIEWKIELARVAQQLGKYDEAEKIVGEILAYNKNLGVENESSSGRLANVLVRTSKAKLARQVLEPMVYAVQNGEKTNQGAVACTDLAAFYIGEGKPEKKKKVLEGCWPLVLSLENMPRLLIAENLLDYASFYKGKPEASILLRYAIFSLPDPVTRRQGVRLLRELTSIQELKPLYPKSFDKAVNSRLNEAIAKSHKFSDAKLIGFE